jgi:hypothetical protein
MLMEHYCDVLNGLVKVSASALKAQQPRISNSIL